MTAPAQQQSAIVVALPADGTDLPAKVVDGQSGAEDDSPLHVTVRYFPDPDPAALPGLVELLQHLADTCGPFEAGISGRGRLGVNDAAVLLVESDAIQDLHDLLDGTMPGGEPDKFPHFTPHLTLGYGDEFDVEALDPATLPERIVFDRIALWNGDDRQEFPMTGTDDLADDPDLPDTGDDRQPDKDLLLAAGGVHDNGPVLVMVAETDQPERIEPLDLGGPLVAAGVAIPPIDTPDDLAAAIAYAAEHPEARWYVEARAAAYDDTTDLPWAGEPLADLDAGPVAAGGNPGDDPDDDPDSDVELRGPGGVQAAAAFYVRAMSLGQQPHTSVYDEMLTEAEATGMMGDPVVLSAVAWHEGAA